MLCRLTANWRRRPLASLEVNRQLIATTQNSKGMTIQAALNVNSYPKGIKISEGEWNYSILRRMTSGPLMPGSWCTPHAWHARHRV